MMKKKINKRGNKSRFNFKMTDWLAETERIFLRETLPSDVNDEYAWWMNDLEVTKYMEARFRKHTKEDIKNEKKQKIDEMVINRQLDFQELNVNNFDAGIKDYIFYVRTADGRRISDYQNAKVDIYLPDNHGDPTSEDNIIVSGVVSTEFRDGRRFSFPYRTYELSKARRSDNNEASVWHVLNFHFEGTYDQIAGLENLYDTNLNRFVTEGWLDFSYPY